MNNGIRVVVVDPDDDYLGIEIFASSGRYSGSTWIFAGLHELSELAEHLKGFPTSTTDERRYEFGSRAPKIAGGYCSMRFYCVNDIGHAALELSFEDDDQRYGVASSHFTFKMEPAALDQFVQELRGIERERAGEAFMTAAV